MFRHKLIGLGAAAFLVLATTMPAQADRAVFAFTHLGGEVKTLDVVTNLSSYMLTALTPLDFLPFVADGAGWYDETGLHSASNPNYVAGILELISGPVEHRNYFAFGGIGSLAPGETISSATLNLTNPDCPTCGYISPNPTETYTLWDVATDPFTLVLDSPSGPGGVAVYTDLGSGVSYGSRVMSAADNGTVVSIALNAAGLAYIFGNIETGIVFGGAMDTTAPIPEPTTMLLLGSGLVGLAAWKRRQPKNG